MQQKYSEKQWFVGCQIHDKTRSSNIISNFHSNGVNATIEYILEVHSISPLVGALMGGTRLTITGSGFSNTTDSHQVFFGSLYGKQPNGITFII